MSRMDRLHVLHQHYRRVSRILGALVYVEQVYGKTGNDGYRRHILDKAKFDRAIALERKIQRIGTGL